MAKLINVTVDDSRLKDAFARIRAAVADPSPALKLMGVYATGEVQGNFDRQSSPEGDPWKRLAASTIRGRRNKTAEGTKILIDTGRLKNSITFSVQSGRVVVGTNVVYSAIQNFGGEIAHHEHERILNFKRDSRTGRQLFSKARKANLSQKVRIPETSTTIPQREFMGLRPQAVDGLVSILDRYLRTATA